MDCMTCLLIGMCMLCGQNFGGSRLQTFTDTEAANPSRPTTKQEVNTELQKAVRHLGNGNTNTNSYRRQSKLDPRFVSLGIGKRPNTVVDPYNFSFGLGKRHFQDGQSDVSRDYDDLDSSRDVTMNFDKPDVANYLDEDRENGAPNPSRPMTKQEVNTELQKAVRHLGNDNTNTNSYRRQSKLDPRFVGLGIGKRPNTVFDPYNFSFGLGKRHFQDGQSDVSRDVTMNFAKPDVANYLDDDRVIGKQLYLQKLSDLHPDGKLFILKHVMERQRAISKTNDFLAEQTRMLQLRRQRQRVDHIFTADEVGR